MGIDIYFPPISIILGYRGLVITILEFVAFFDAIPLRNEEERDCSMFDVPSIGTPRAKSFVSPIRSKN